MQALIICNNYAGALAALAHHATTSAHGHASSASGASGDSLVAALSGERAFFFAKFACHLALYLGARVTSTTESQSLVVTANVRACVDAFVHRIIANRQFEFLPQYATLLASAAQRRRCLAQAMLVQVAHAHAHTQVRETRWLFKSL